MTETDANPKATDAPRGVLTGADEYLERASRLLAAANPAAAERALRHAVDLGAPAHKHLRLDARIQHRKGNARGALKALRALVALGETGLPRCALPTVKTLVHRGEIEGVRDILPALRRRAHLSRTLPLIEIRLAALELRGDEAILRCNALLRQRCDAARSARDPDLVAVVRLAAQLLKFIRLAPETVEILAEIQRRWPDIAMPGDIAADVSALAAPAATSVAGTTFADVLEVAATGDFTAASALLDAGISDSENAVAATDFNTALAHGRFDGPPLRAVLADDPKKDVLISETGPANTVVLVFCGITHETMLPVRLLDRLIAAQGFTSIFLRDRRQILFGRGIESLGNDLEQTLEALHGLIGATGAREVVTLGASGGGFPAIQYGIRLRAKRILNLAGPTNLERAFLEKIGEKRARIMQKRLQAEAPADYLDCRAGVLAAPSGCLHQFYAGTDALIDRAYCTYLQGIAHVHNHELRGLATHRTICRMLAEDRFIPCLRGDMDADTPRERVQSSRWTRSLRS